MSERRSALIEVQPGRGDACRVLDFAGRAYREAEAIPGRVLASSRPGLAIVEFRGREAEIAIEPDWASEWRAGQVEYREVSPLPQFGDEVLPTARDEGQSYHIELCLLGLHQAAESIRAQTFDKHWLCCLKRGKLRRLNHRDAEPVLVDGYGERGLFDDAPPPPPERKRAWVRWEVCNRAWVQAGHKDVLAMLEHYKGR